MSRMTALVGVLLLLLHGVCAQSPLTLPIVQYTKDNGRISSKMFHGDDETAITTRLFFTAPVTSTFRSPPTSNSTDTNNALLASADDLIILPHTAFALRFEASAVSRVRGSAIPAMATSRFMARGSSHLFGTEIASRFGSEFVIPDWGSGSRWSAGIFLDTHSSIWTRWACMELRGLPYACPELALLRSRECAARRESLYLTRGKGALEWNVRPYSYSLPRDATNHKHVRHAGVWLLGQGRLRDPLLNDSARAVYPVVMDLESTRNFLPAELHALCLRSGSRGVTIVIAFVNSNTGEELRLRCSAASVAGSAETRLGSVLFERNSGSQEIILGIQFVQTNYSNVLFDARHWRVTVTLAPPVASEALRGAVSVLILVLGALGLRWMDSSNYTSLALMVQHLSRAAFTMPFESVQSLFEMTAIGVSGLIIALTASYVIADGPYTGFAAVIIAQWSFHALLALVLIALSPEVLVHMRSSLIQRARLLLHGTPDAMIAVPSPFVIARNAIHMLVITNGVIVGLLLSQYSTLVLFIVALVAAFAVYHMAYYATGMIVSTVVFGRSVRGSLFGSAAWGLYLLIELAMLLLVTASGYTQLMLPMLMRMNAFYSDRFVQITALTVPLLLCGTGVYAACDNIYAPFRQSLLSTPDDSKKTI